MSARRVLRWPAALSLMWLVGVHTTGLAADEPQLRLSGFGTLAATRASTPPGWAFRRDALQPSHAGGTRLETDSLVGIQANYALMPQVEAVVQLQGKRRVAAAKTSESLEWAFVAYRPNDDWTVRFGRTSPPVYLLSEYRNVGFAYPSIRPNMEVYGGLAIGALDGLDVSRSWGGESVRWQAKGFVGNGRIRTPGTNGRPDGDFRLDTVHGMTLQYESNGLLLQGTLARTRVDLGNAYFGDVLQQGLTQLQLLGHPQLAREAAALAGQLDPQRAPVNYVAFGASYDRDAWLISGEVARLTSRLSSANQQLAHVSLGRRFQSVLGYMSVGSARSSRAPLDNPQWAALVAPTLGPFAAQAIQALGTGAALSLNNQIRQRSLSLGMRWDVNSHMALKWQWDRFSIEPNGAGTLWLQPGSAAARVRVMSVGLDFVF